MTDKNPIRIDWQDLSNARPAPAAPPPATATAPRPMAFGQSNVSQRLPPLMKANRLLEGRTCSLCHTPLEMGQDVRNCEACLLSYHLECWQLNGGCGTYGCGKAPGGKGLVPDANTLRIDLPKVQGSAKEDLDPSGVPVGKITPIRDRVRTGQSGTEIGHAETLAVLSLVLGILSFFALALFFGPGAIVCGAIAGSKGKTMGWIGMALGIIGTVWWVQILMSSGA